MLLLFVEKHEQCHDVGFSSKGFFGEWLDNFILEKNSKKKKKKRNSFI